MNRQIVARELVAVAGDLMVADTTQVARLAKQILDAEDEARNVADRAGEKVLALGSKSGKAQGSLLALLAHKLRGDDAQEAASAIVDVFRHGRLNTGVLSSGLVNELGKATGEKIYPSPWSTNRQKWAIVSE